jgi:hypothetical protein
MMSLFAMHIHFLLEPPLVLLVRVVALLLRFLALLKFLHALPVILLQLYLVEVRVLKHMTQ